MDSQLMQFDIVGLHGVRDYSILFEDNKVIIVGENGSGKTTVFKIMYHTLSCDWDSLRTFDFECVSLHFGTDKVVQISSDLLQSIYAIADIDRVAYYVDGRPRNRRIHVDLLNSVISIKRKADGKSSEELDRLYMDRPVPYQYIRAVLETDAVARLYEITREIENFGAPQAIKGCQKNRDSNRLVLRTGKQRGNFLNGIRLCPLIAHVCGFVRKVRNIFLDVPVLDAPLQRGTHHGVVFNDTVGTEAAGNLESVVVFQITGGQFADRNTPEIKVRANVRIQNIEVLIIGCLCNIT